MKRVLNLLARHWKATLVALALLWSGLYWSTTPSFAVWQMKRAIDSHDAARAAAFVDFQSVVKKAGYEMLKERGDQGVLGDLLGKGAVELLSKPIAQATEDWTKRQVAAGAREVQMPAAAVGLSVLMLHRNGDTAYTSFRDNKGRDWEIHLARRPDKGWQVVEVKNIAQLLEELRRRQGAELNYEL